MWKGSCGKKVRLFNKDGVELIENSISQASKDLGISMSTLRKRIKDGYCIRLPNVPRGIFVELVGGKQMKQIENLKPKECCQSCQFYDSKYFTCVFDRKDMKHVGYADSFCKRCDDYQMSDSYLSEDETPELRRDEMIMTKEEAIAYLQNEAESFSDNPTLTEYQRGYKNAVTEAVEVISSLGEPYWQSGEPVEEGKYLFKSCTGFLRVLSLDCLKIALAGDLKGEWHLIPLKTTINRQ